MILRSEDKWHGWDAAGEYHSRAVDVNEIPDTSPTAEEILTADDEWQRPEWMEHGECLKLPGGSEERARLFYPSDRAGAEVAKAICRRCPVIDPCLSYAIKHHERGIWGGCTEGERAKLERAARMAGEL